MEDDIFFIKNTRNSKELLDEEETLDIFPEEIDIEDIADEELIKEENSEEI